MTSSSKPVDPERQEIEHRYSEMVANETADRIIRSLGRGMTSEQLVSIAERLLEEARSRAGRF
jgi:hypothetical protein